MGGVPTRSDETFVDSAGVLVSSFWVDAVKTGG
jgi:hypothetical protein